MSTDDFPFLKFAYSWQSILSSAAVMRLKTLLIRDSRIMSLQLPQFPRSPFFANLPISLGFHFLGVASASHRFCNIFWRMSCVSYFSALNISGHLHLFYMLCYFFRLWVALSTSSTVMSLMLMSRPLSASWTSANMAGSGWFRMFWKSSHLSSFALSFVAAAPSENRTGMPCFWSHFLTNLVNSSHVLLFSCYLCFFW